VLDTMSHGSMATIYELNGVSSCHTCGADSLVICRGCAHGFCREHFQMCTTCFEWLCGNCFEIAAKHRCKLIVVIKIHEEGR